MSDAQIRSELEEIMYAHMEMSGQRKFFGHKRLPTDLGSWKLGRSHTDKYGIRYDVYRCPMRHWCTCHISMRVVTGPDFIELQRCWLHDKNSHDNYQSKKIEVQPNCFLGLGRQDCADPFRPRAPQESV